MNIRRFEQRDRAAVVALWSDVFAGDPSWNAPEDVIDRKLRVQPELFLVGEQERELVATVLGGYDGFRGWVYHLAVAQSRRRRGLGGAMMRALEELLTERGCPKVNLQVRAGNEELVSFYRSLGYGVEARESLGRRLG